MYINIYVYTYIYIYIYIYYIYVYTYLHTQMKSILGQAQCVYLARALNKFHIDNLLVQHDETTLP